MASGNGKPHAALHENQRELAAGEILTLTISLLSFLGVVLMTRMLSGVWKNHVAIQRSEAVLRLKNIVFDTSIAAICFTDLAGLITETKSAFFRLWRYVSEVDVVGMPMKYFFNDPKW